MFVINKMSPIQKKYIYLPQTIVSSQKKYIYLPQTIVSRCSEKFRKISN